VSIECNKDGVKFSCAGDIGSGSVTLKPNQTVDKPSDNVNIELSEPVALTFSLKYLTNFCKASGLSDQVKLCLSSEVPLLVEYGLQENSYLRFYLAPKVRFSTLRLLLDHSNTQADWRRGVSESRILSTQAACFQDRCGVLRRNGFDLHIERLSGSWFRRAKWARTRILSPLVFRALGTIGRLTPHQTLSRHRAEFQIRKSTLYIDPTSSLLPPFLFLLPSPK
jgi:hypothetical protein